MCRPSVSLIGLSRVALLLSIGCFAAPGAAGAVAVEQPIVSDAVYVSVSQTLAPGVTASGVVMLSEFVRSVESPSKPIRVLFLHLTIHIPSGEIVSFYGAPLVEAGANAAILSPGVGTRPRPGEIGPRFNCRASIEPAPGKTWGMVTEPDDLIVRIDYEE